MGNLGHLSETESPCSGLFNVCLRFVHSSSFRPLVHFSHHSVWPFLCPIWLDNFIFLKFLLLCPFPGFPSNLVMCFIQMFYSCTMWNTSLSYLVYISFLSFYLFLYIQYFYAHLKAFQSFEVSSSQTPEGHLNNGQWIHFLPMIWLISLLIGNDTKLLLIISKIITWLHGAVKWSVLADASCDSWNSWRM